MFLCPRCSNELIEPHPRLYRAFQPNEPLPGVMDLCADCIHREGSRCKCPLAMFNGGPAPGLDIKLPENSVTRAFVDGRRYSGPMTFYTAPAVSCSGKNITRQ